MTERYKCEFHVHTRYSKDSFQSFLLMLLMCKIHNIRTLVICDHNEVRGALLHRRGFRKYGVEIIVGEEIFTAEGEMIGINLKKRIEPGLSPEETIRQIRSQGGLVYVPHPFDEKRYKTVLSEDAIARCRDNIDFMEIHNGRNCKKEFSLRQNEMADKYGITPVVGSDAHTFFELGRNYVITDRPIVGRLRAGDLDNAEFVTSDYLPLAHKATKVAKALKMILRGDFLELFGIIYKKLA